MENILINKLELASELAHLKLVENYNTEIEIYAKQSYNGIYYTDEAQDIFNEYYDEFLYIIEYAEIKK